jgi:hypothetical protein
MDRIALRITFRLRAKGVSGGQVVRKRRWLQGLGGRIAEARGWFATVTSVVAFGISVTTGYFALLPIDDVRVVLNVKPTVFASDDQKWLMLRLETGSMTFINSGNRAASIDAISLDVSSGPGCSRSILFQRHQLAFAPIVIKSGEIIRSEIKLPDEDNKWFVSGAPSESEVWLEKEINEAHACAIFNMVTPDNEVEIKAIELPTDTMTPIRSTSYDESTGYSTAYGGISIVHLKGPRTVPVTLIRRRWMW